jgi:GTP-binding protein
MTRLANLYRVARPSVDAGQAGRPFYLIDLPGYGYARGGRKTAQEFETLAASLFGGQVRQAGRALPALPAPLSALLIVDARHPGLESDRAAWEWMKVTVAARVIVATKIDKLARGQRIRALAGLESVFEHPVAAVSAETGEGLNELWKLIARLTKPA